METFAAMLTVGIPVILGVTLHCLSFSINTEQYKQRKIQNGAITEGDVQWISCLVPLGTLAYICLHRSQLKYKRRSARIAGVALLAWALLLTVFLTGACADVLARFHVAEGITALLFITINLLCSAWYASDKKRAQEHQWRVPEYLLLQAAVCAPVGAALTMFKKGNRHKTRHPAFIAAVAFGLFAWAYLCWEIRW